MRIIATPNYRHSKWEKRQNCHLNLISGAYQRSVAISGKKKNRTKKVSQKKLHNQNGTEVLN